MHFRTNAAPTGSGKTYAATTFACERIPPGMKTAILQPTSIDAVEEIRQRPDYQPAINTSGFLAYMEHRWRSAPLGHGRTEFWFLAQGLKKLGWDAYKIRAKLVDEVIYANSPAERESEIDALMLSI